MTDRERLIDLIKKAEKQELLDFFTADLDEAIDMSGGIQFNGTVEHLADYLISNDVVEVVRCRDCKYWDKVKNPKHAGKGICISPNKSIGGYCTRRGATLENDYCSLGARKDGGVKE